MKKRLTVIIAAIIAVILILCIIISPDYVFLSSYNEGKKGFVNINKIERIELHNSDNNELKLKKIRKCKNLNTLFIDYNVDDLRFLEGMSLQDLYFLSDCNDWESLQYIKEIKGLYIIPIYSGNHSTFDNCSILRKFDMLEELEIINFEEEIDFSGLEELINLRTLDISSCYIDFNKISFPDDLENLSLRFGDDNEINHFPQNIELLNKINLKKLAFWQSYIEDISFLYNISNINVIEFHDCIFYETESEINTVISDLKKKNVDIILENNTFSE